MREYAIETEELTKAFGDVRAVDGLNLQVPVGSIFGLLGPNGAGKTTTIKMLLGLVAPTSGSARVLGFDVRTQSEEIRRRVGYLSETSGMYGYMSVGELLSFTRRLYPRWDKAVEDKYIDLFRLPRTRRVSALSRGMRTQLGLILALAPCPELIVLDEPTNGLDPVGVRHFLQVILDEVSGSGQTVLMSSHMLYQVERVADRVGLLVRGKLLLSKPMDQLKLGQKKIQAAFQVDPPDKILKMPGIERVDHDGRRYVIHVSDNVDEIVAKLREIPHFAVEVVDLNLEDIFMEYAGNGSEPS